MTSVLQAYQALRARHEVMIVEGIGGLLVPLTDRLTVADLARRMRLPLVIVARPGLGTLNHTLLTLAQARRAHLPVRGVLINHAQPPSRNPMARLAERTNPHILRRLGSVPLLGEVAFARRVDKRLLARLVGL